MSKNTTPRVISLIVLVTCLLAACGSFSQPTPTVPAPAPTPAASPRIAQLILRRGQTAEFYPATGGRLVLSVKFSSPGVEVEPREDATKYPVAIVYISPDELPDGAGHQMIIEYDRNQVSGLVEGNPQVR